MNTPDIIQIKLNGSYRTLNANEKRMLSHQNSLIRKFMMEIYESMGEILPVMELDNYFKFLEDKDKCEKTICSACDHPEVLMEHFSVYWGARCGSIKDTVLTTLKPYLKDGKYKLKLFIKEYFEKQTKIITSPRKMKDYELALLCSSSFCYFEPFNFDRLGDKLQDKSDIDKKLAIVEECENDLPLCPLANFDRDNETYSALYMLYSNNDWVPKEKLKGIGKFVSIFEYCTDRTTVACNSASEYLVSLIKNSCNVAVVSEDKKMVTNVSSETKNALNDMITTCYKLSNVFKFVKYDVKAVNRWVTGREQNFTINCKGYFSTLCLNLRNQLAFAFIERVIYDSIKKEDNE